MGGETKKKKAKKRKKKYKTSQRAPIDVCLVFVCPPPTLPLPPPLFFNTFLEPTSPNKQKPSPMPMPLLSSLDKIKGRPRERRE